MEDRECEICGEVKHCISIDLDWTAYSCVCYECWTKYCEEEGY